MLTEKLSPEDPRASALAAVRLLLFSYSFSIAAVRLQLRRGTYLWHHTASSTCGTSTRRSPHRETGRNKQSKQ
ncbi:hypothetical protein SynBIOSE41_01616 [Synechococcus sp. BIOS-E4-1]|nr:hypothetical protein SynBIOSE41_01616 [Synechococcus sp. BIOS-E4-1]